MITICENKEKIKKRDVKVSYLSSIKQWKIVTRLEIEGVIVEYLLYSKKLSFAMDDIKSIFNTNKKLEYVL